MIRTKKLNLYTAAISVAGVTHLLASGPPGYAPDNWVLYVITGVSYLASVALYCTDRIDPAYFEIIAKSFLALSLVHALGLCLGFETLGIALTHGVVTGLYLSAAVALRGRATLEI